MFPFDSKFIQEYHFCCFRSHCTFLVLFETDIINYVCILHKPRIKKIIAHSQNREKFLDIIYRPVKKTQY